jgi:hypothetical protein
LPSLFHSNLSLPSLPLTRLTQCTIPEGLRGLPLPTPVIPLTLSSSSAPARPEAAATDPEAPESESARQQPVSFHTGQIPHTCTPVARGHGPGCPIQQAYPGPGCTVSLLLSFPIIVLPPSPLLIQNSKLPHAATRLLR